MNAKIVKGVAFVLVVLSFLSILYPIFFTVGDKFLMWFTYAVPFVTLLVLSITLLVYANILEVSEKTLTFTKTQTSFNSYFDNYKLFNELSRRKTDMLYHLDIDDGFTKYFEELTFDTLNHNLRRLLINYDRYRNHPAYKEVFNRFYGKIQSFIDTMKSEYLRIKTDSALLPNQKETLLSLYENFLLADYIYLGRDLAEETLRHKTEDIRVSDLLFCNRKENDKVTLDFDPDRYLGLYYEIFGR